MEARAAQRMMDEVVGVIISGFEGQPCVGTDGAFTVRREKRAHKSSPRGTPVSRLLSGTTHPGPSVSPSRPLVRPCC